MICLSRLAPVLTNLCGVPSGMTTICPAVDHTPTMCAPDPPGEYLDTVGINAVSKALMPAGSGNWQIVRNVHEAFPHPPRDEWEGDEADGRVPQPEVERRPGSVPADGAHRSFLLRVDKSLKPDWYLANAAS